MDDAKEVLDKDDVKTVKKVIGKLNKDKVKTQINQDKTLTKDIQDSYEFGTPEVLQKIH